MAAPLSTADAGGNSTTSVDANHLRAGTVIGNTLSETRSSPRSTASASWLIGTALGSPFLVSCSWASFRVQSMSSHPSARISDFRIPVSIAQRRTGPGSGWETR